MKINSRYNYRSWTRFYIILRWLSKFPMPSIMIKRSRLWRNPVMPSVVSSSFPSTNARPSPLWRLEPVICANSRENWSISAIVDTRPPRARRSFALIALHSSTRIAFLIPFRKLIRGGVPTYARFAGVKIVASVERNHTASWNSTQIIQFTPIFEAEWNGRVMRRSNKERKRVCVVCSSKNSRS